MKLVCKTAAPRRRLAIHARDKHPTDIRHRPRFHRAYNTEGFGVAYGCENTAHVTANMAAPAPAAPTASPSELTGVAGQTRTFT